MKPAYLLVPLLVAAFALTEAALVVAGGLRTSEPYEVQTILNAIVFAHVSLAVLWGAMVRLSIGWRVALVAAAPASGGLAIWGMHSGDGALSQSTVFLVSQAIALSLMVDAASAAGVSFGRMDDDAARAGGLARWQTSIGSLLLLTTTTAASLSLLKWLIRPTDVERMSQRWAEYVLLGLGNLALAAGLSAGILLAGRWWFRSVILVAGMIVAFAASWWMFPPLRSVMVWMQEVQTIALAIGLATFRACGWRIFRRRPQAAE